MYPLSDSALPLLDLAKHWRRQLEGQPPSEEILGTLLQAFWQRTLVLCRADGKLVGRELLLQMVKALPPGTCWSEQVISEACSSLAACRWSDYSAPAQAGFAFLEVSRDAFEALCVERGYERPSFWFGRQLKGMASKNLVGRPSVLRSIEAEMRRRALGGSLEPKLSKEALALHAWAVQNIPMTKQIPRPHSIENGLRELYWELRRPGRKAP